MLTAEQQHGFATTGILTLEGCFSEGDARAMRDVVWSELSDRFGIRPDDPVTWDRPPPTGLSTTKAHRVFAPILGPALATAVDELLGAEIWATPKHFGQILVTMPNAREWRVPHWLWHTDFDFHYPAGELVAIKCWVLLDEIRPGGGGTALLAGSHRLVMRYLEGRPPAELEYKRVSDGLFRSHPWLRSLIQPDDDPDRNQRFMASPTNIDGIEARVMEITGKAGDIFITHPWVFHAVTDNATDRPRLMRSLAIYRQGFLRN